MEQMTTLCDMVGQAIQKKEEEKRIAEEQAVEDRYWKIPICYDDDDNYTIAITPVSPTKEPVNSLNDEIVSLEVVDIVIPEVEGIDTDILLTIKDDILRENCPGFLIASSAIVPTIKRASPNPSASFWEFNNPNLIVYRLSLSHTHKRIRDLRRKPSVKTLRTRPGHLTARLGCAETKVATWDDLAFKLIILGWNVKHRILQTLIHG
ncbi:hypothetical protein Tco_0459277 [Tanacetum coccineum]